MLTSLCEFVNRHKEKIYWAGFAVGGATLISKYVENRVGLFSRQHTEELQEQQNLEKRYGRTLSAARIMLRNSLPKIRAMLEKDLDPTDLLDGLKNDPENKRKYWEQLKLIGLSRAIGCILCGALIAPMTHVVELTLSGHASPFGQNSSDGDEILSVELQTEYLKIIDDIIDEQLPKLLRKAMKIIDVSVSTLPLNSKFTIQQFESVLEEITVSIISKGAPEKAPVPDAESILPWSQYVSDPDFDVLNCEEASKLESLYYFTLDVIGTEEFHEVVKSLIDAGRSYILDEIAPLYFDSEADLLKSSTDERTDSASNPLVSSGSVNSVYLVKLIPVLNNVAKSALPNELPKSPQDPYNEYFNRLALNPKLESLAFTIYDSVVLNN